MKNFLVSSWDIAVALVASWCPPECLPVPPVASAIDSSRPGRHFLKCADVERYALDLPRIYRINKIPNNYFSAFFPDESGVNR